MAIKVTSRHFEMTDALQEFIAQKLKKLERYFDKIINVHVILESHRGRNLAEINIQGKGLTIHSEEYGTDMYSCIDVVVEKIENKLKRLDERKKDKTTRKPSIRRYQHLPVRDDGIDEETKRKFAKLNVTKIDRFSLRPMDIEEAIMQMESFDTDFLVFQNAKTGMINVVYRRKIRGYGLIEPEF